MTHPSCSFISCGGFRVWSRAASTSAGEIGRRGWLDRDGKSIHPSRPNFSEGRSVSLSPGERRRFPAPTLSLHLCYWPELLLLTQARWLKCPAGEAKVTRGAKISKSALVLRITFASETTGKASMGRQLGHSRTNRPTLNTLIFQKNLKLGLWGSLTRWRRLSQYWSSTSKGQRVIASGIFERPRGRPFFDVR